MTGFRRRVPGRSRADISTQADLLRHHVQLLAGDGPDAFPVVEYVDIVLPQVIPEFVLELVEDHEMHGMEGATWPDQLHMKLPQSVYDRAAAGEGRSRFTLCHELGHLLLHQQIPFARESHRPIATYECSEWQANEFAAALLMPAHILMTCASVAEVMERCRVSKAAAENRLKVLHMRKPHGW